MSSPRRPPILSGERKRYLAALIAVGLAQTSLAVALMLTVKWVFDALAAQGLQGDHMLGVGTGLLGLAVLGPGVQYAHAHFAEQLGQSYVEVLRARLFAHLLKLSPRALQARHRGGLTLRFIGDMGALRRWISLGLARLIVTGMTATGVLIVLATESVWLAVGLALSLVAGVLAAWRVGEGLQPRTLETRRRTSRLAAFINERVVAISSIHACGQGLREQRRMRRNLSAVRRASVARMGWAGLTRGVAESGALLAYSAVLLIGALEVMSGAASVGMVVAAMTTVGILMPQLRGLGRVLEYWHGYRVSARKIDDLFALKGRIRQVAAPVRVSETEGSIRFEGLSLAGSVQNVSATLPAGGRVAVVGANGSGKSTLLAALVRLVEPLQGRIFLDGHDIGQLHLRDLRRQVGLVSQDLPLLRGTVEYNLTYACRRPDPTWRAQVERWCGIEALVSQWPEGRMHRITDGGANLSAGQRVRIMLARALFGAPKVLLLDEIDGVLDGEGVSLIDAMLEAYPGTVLWVSHTESRFDRADQMWYLGIDGQLTQTARANQVLPLRRRVEA